MKPTSSQFSLFSKLGGHDNSMDSTAGMAPGENYFMSGGLSSSMVRGLKATEGLKLFGKVRA